MERYRPYMEQALALAREAGARGDVPVGALVLRDGKVIGRGCNRREADCDVTAHAEVLALREACAALGDWKLEDCTLVVTLEPCPMCAGAILNARIPRVVYGASDDKCGAVRSVCSLFDMGFNHHPQVESGIREEECAQLLKEFFQKLRIELRSRPKWRPKEKDNTL